MKLLAKSYLFQGKILTICSCIVFAWSAKSQPVNYINNGGFEDVVTYTSTPFFYHARYWGSTDTLNYYGEPLSANTIPIKVPLSGYTYQWPRHGNNHLITTLYCSTCAGSKRGYPRNRLKQILKQNTSYCYSMYVNLSNQSTHGIDRLAAYFGDFSIDTISRCDRPITYLNPQVENVVNNLITDTLRWVLIQGQFVATGTEKYVLIGNFKNDTSTNKTLVNPTNLPANVAEYLIDDVSLIESDLPAFAGNDTLIFVGDSVFLGREPDVGIDEACIWYKLPDVSNAIDTVAGFWIKPASTETYIVRQEICGNVKWDTVVVKPVLNVGNVELKMLNVELELFPNPADENLELKIKNEELKNSLTGFRIYDNLGQLIREEKLKSRINVSDLPEGVYFLELSSKAGTARKRFVVAR